MTTIKEFKKLYHVSITEKHTGKMNGLKSLSTSPLDNKYCQSRINNNDMICSKCFSIQMQKRYNNLSAMLKENSKTLYNQIIPVQDLPIIDSLYFRFEAFGDLATVQQIVNYFNIAKYNKLVKFALWTKNPIVIQKAIKEYNLKKPENLKIIFSSYFINYIPKYDIAKVFTFIDKVFTVYDKKTAKTVEINCGAKSCLKCHLCYTDDKIKYINEIVK